jgi:hypothetical protein
MIILIVKAYLQLIRFNSHIVGGNFKGLQTQVRDCVLADKQADDQTTQRVCYAIDVACIWYWKHVLCLQRSAATACLLKSNGVPATLVIGAQQMPFRAHAWVEVNGKVVNDKSYVRDMYLVLDRC